MLRRQLWPRIRQRAMRARARRGSHLSWFDRSMSHDVKYLPARVEEIIGNDAAVTSPPHRLGTHNGNSVPLPKAHQLFQTLSKLRRRCVIRIVSEALVLPERVQ